MNKAPTSPKALEKDATGTKERRAQVILQPRRLLRLADAAQTKPSQRDIPPANPSAAIDNGE